MKKPNWKEVEKSVKRWATKKNLAMTGVVTVSILMITGISVALLWDRPAAPSNGTIVDDTGDGQAIYRHPLTGEVLDWTGGAEGPGYDELPQVFGIMVENAADAWPLVGLDEAFLVIEAPVEGSIPRFITFFSDEQDVEKIGPVRSARPYYVDWADELDAVYTHVGGSPEALEKIRDEGTIDLNEFYQGEYFYRWSARYAPHNTYTTSQDLADAMLELKETYGWDEDDAPRYDLWKFKNDEPSTTHAISICVDWTTGETYDICWQYDAEANAYVRERMGAPIALENGANMIADNVVVMSTEITTVDREGRRHLDTVGAGDAVIVQDGEMTLGTWKKDTRTSRLRFFDGSGVEVEMNAGKTWIEVVASLTQVSSEDAKASE